MRPLVSARKRRPSSTAVASLSTPVTEVVAAFQMVQGQLVGGAAVPLVVNDQMVVGIALDDMLPAERTVAFFFRAISRQQAQKAAVVFTNRWTLVVEQWENVPDSTAKWRLWAAQPLYAGSAWSVERVLATKPPGWYVAYILRPTQRSLEAVDSCLARVQGRRGRPVA